MEAIDSFFRVETEFPVALDSRDHTHPHGTAADNSRNISFNHKLYKLFYSPTKLFSIMDLGCSGGGFVKDCIDDGHLAIGLEGSDYSKARQRAEWSTIPQNLFTCDITKPFQVYYNFIPFRFDVITGWELLEHLPEESLGQFLTNCIQHLAEKGLLIFSISQGVEFWHVCVHDEVWWDAVFDRYGLENRPDLVEYFGEDWIRAGGSFHRVLQRRTS